MAHLPSAIQGAILSNRNMEEEKMVSGYLLSIPGAYYNRSITEEEVRALYEIND